MKLPKTSSLFLIMALVTGIALTGCATMDSDQTPNLLAAAGFKSKTPKTEKQRQVYDDIDSYKMLTGKVNGQRLYGYKDAKNGLVYVGNEKQYQTYKRLAAKRNIAEENLMAAEMDQERIDQYRSLVPYGYWN